MIFEKRLTPDVTMDSFRGVTPEYLRSLGAAALVSDIDNTLAPYEDATPSEEVVRWAGALKDAGISLTLISNNRRSRVEKFCRGLGCLSFARVKKPSPKYILIAMERMGSDRTNTVFLGDQLLTDALAAHRAGLKAIIVPPIKDKKSLFFRAKRLIEKPYLKKYRKLHPSEE